MWLRNRQDIASPAFLLYLNPWTVFVIMSLSPCACPPSFPLAFKNHVFNTCYVFKLYTKVAITHAP